MNEHNPKIYLLPNLMTAGNLFCGFAATLEDSAGSAHSMVDSGRSGRLCFTPQSGSFSALAFSMCSTAASRVWGDRTGLWPRIRFLSRILFSFGVAPALNGLPNRVD
jgi:CDP-diacylglycerol--serine O-phosphatidyltransferase